ncbi:DUF3820 family protein [Mucilaginibacter defluvii]|uniref:DUF3820 family protein n=1 Tax=Mucilaginibacter defluvii TaxID=1196019 RepID=A0ABP9FR33_9SPHI
MENIVPDKEVLINAVTLKMPFGKYKGTLLCDLPVYYLEWLHNKGFPAGKLGMALSTVFEIKTNGVTGLLLQVKQYVQQQKSDR